MIIITVPGYLGQACRRPDQDLEQQLSTAGYIPLVDKTVMGILLLSKNMTPIQIPGAPELPCQLPEEGSA